MPKTKSFDVNADKYDKWFDNNRFIYESELEAIKQLIPDGLLGIEIGIGTGRFALPLNISQGVEPSENMAEIARKKGIQVLKGVAENLPIENKSYDFVLMVTSICFLDNIQKSFNEIYRILKNDGFFIVGFIDKESKLGRQYESKKNNSIFYQEANFYSVSEVIKLLKQTGFKISQFRQTIFKSNLSKIDLIKYGYGEGSFVVIKAEI